MKLKIGTKLMGGFGIILLLSLIMGIINYASLKKVCHLNKSVFEMEGQRRFIVEKECDHLAWVEQLADTILTGKEFKAQRDWNKCGIGKWYYNYIESENYKHASGEFKKLLKDFEPPHISLHKSADNIIAALDNRNTDKAISLYQSQTQKALEELTPVLHEIGGHYKNVSEENLKEVDTSIKAINVSMFLILFIAITIGIIIALVTARNITLPLKKVVNIAQKIAGGDLSEIVEGIKSNDEIKLLSDSFNDMVLNLRKVIGNIRNSVEQIAAASEEISSNAQNVSQGAQNQSSTIEEITASVEELTTSINNVAKNSQDTNEIAQNAAQQASDGGKSVDSSVEGMKEISKSSSQIADIIGTISDIADQTNLLALNAAIEAARAGEHGMGFAVVADEVRKLAERTQGAAKEITMLIRESTKNVEDGGKLSEEAGAALKKIVDSVQKTTEQIGKISSATEEQSATAGEVSKAVENVSKITEENAGASEEMASSSEELASQAAGLRQIVAKFKVNAEGETEESGAAPQNLVHKGEVKAKIEKAAGNKTG